MSTGIHLWGWAQLSHLPNMSPLQNYLLHTLWLPLLIALWASWTPVLLPNEKTTNSPTNYNTSFQPHLQKQMSQTTTQSPTKTRSPTHQYGTWAKQALLQCDVAYICALLNATNTVTDKLPEWALHSNAFNPVTGKNCRIPKLSKCSNGALWQLSNAKKIGQLDQGHNNVKGTNTIFFISPRNVPKGCKVTYICIVAAYRPKKDNPHCVHCTIGSNNID